MYWSSGRRPSDSRRSLATRWSLAWLNWEATWATDGLLGQDLAVELGLQHDEVGLGGPKRRLGVDDLLLELGVGELQQHRCGIHLRARKDPDALDRGPRWRP